MAKISELKIVVFRHALFELLKDELNLINIEIQECI